MLEDLSTLTFPITSRQEFQLEEGYFFTIVLTPCSNLDYVRVTTKLTIGRNGQVFDMEFKDTDNDSAAVSDEITDQMHELGQKYDYYCDESNRPQEREYEHPDNR